MDVGDKVKFTHAFSGKVMRGVVVQFVPAGQIAHTHGQPYPGGARTTDSFLVQVGNSVYWPENRMYL